MSGWPIWAGALGWVGRRTLVGPGKRVVLESLLWGYQLHTEVSLLVISGHIFLPKKVYFLFCSWVFFPLVFLCTWPCFRSYLLECKATDPAFLSPPSTCCLTIEQGTSSNPFGHLSGSQVLIWVGHDHHLQGWGGGVRLTKNTGFPVPPPGILIQHTKGMLDLCVFNSFLT